MDKLRPQICAGSGAICSARLQASFTTRYASLSEESCSASPTVSHMAPNQSTRPAASSHFQDRVSVHSFNDIHDLTTQGPRRLSTFPRRPRPVMQPRSPPAHSLTQNLRPPVWDAVKRRTGAVRCVQRIRKFRSGRLPAHVHLLSDATPRVRPPSLGWLRMSYHDSEIRVRGAARPMSKVLTFTLSASRVTIDMPPLSRSRSAR